VTSAPSTLPHAGLFATAAGDHVHVPSTRHPVSNVLGQYRRDQPIVRLPQLRIVTITGLRSRGCRLLLIGRSSSVASTAARGADLIEERKLRNQRDPASRRPVFR